MVFVIALLLLWSGDAAAQRQPAKKAPARKAAPAPAPAATRWPIESLAVEGNRHYTKDQVLAVAGLKLGQPAGKAEFEAARDRLLASGAFETVGYRFAPAPNGTGYAASFQITEVEPVYPVQFERLAAPAAELTRWLKSQDVLFGTKIPATKGVLDRYTKLVEQYLETHQHPEKVAARLAPAGPNEYTIVFRPAKEAPSVAQVSFEGNKVVPSNLLHDVIAAVAIGVPFSEERFRELLDTSVRPIYDARGRIRVAFSKVTAEPAKDVLGVAVKVTLDEGPSYSLGEVKVDGNLAVKPQDLIKAGDIKTGDIANFDQVAQGVERMKTALHHLGYLHADAKVERKIDDGKKTVDATVHIDEGPQFVFGKLEVKGLDLHGEAAIRKMWTLKEGKAYNAGYPQHFLDRVREEGLFDDLGKTRYTAEVNEQAHTVDVTLTFAGAPPPPERKRPGGGQ